MVIIYKVTNNVNGKVYIGKTSRSLKTRWMEHLTDCKNIQKCCRPLYLAINKYGKDNFTIDQIELCDDSVGNEREMFWIKHYDSQKSGYNATVGGDGWVRGSHRKNIESQTILNEYLKGKTVVGIAKESGLSYKTVKSSLLESGIKIRNHIYDKSNPVGMFNLDGILMNTFRSAKEAGRFIGKDDRNIGRCCRGYGRTAYGFVWKYVK